MARLGDLVRRSVMAPFKILLPRSPVARLLILVLLIAVLVAFLEPVLNLVVRGFEGIVRLATPLFDNPVGRLLLVNVLLVVTAIVAWRLLGGRIRRMRTALRLRRHLDAIDALLRGETGRAAALFRTVTRRPGLVPAEYPAIQTDACLKLARLALAEERPNEALAWLTRIRDSDVAPEWKRSVAQLRCRAWIAQGEILPQTVERELRDAVAMHQKDAVLWGLFRDFLASQNRWTEAAEAQQEVLEYTLPAARPAARERLVADWIAAGDEALAAGDLARAKSCCRRARAADPEADEPGLLAGRVALAGGDPKAAIREWGRTRSTRGLEAIGGLLDTTPDVMSPRELMEACPMAGTLLIVARQYARAGDHRKAMRAAQRAARTLGPTPSVVVVLAEVFRLCGDVERARALREEGLLRLVAPDGSAG